MISESERPSARTSVWKMWRSPLGLELPRSAPAMTSEVTWQDAFEPELPADFACSVPQNPRRLARRPSAHKLILIGMSLGAAVQMLGYLGAALLW